MSRLELAKPDNTQVIAALESLLQDARDGLALGMLYVVLRPERDIRFGRVGDMTDADAALALHDLSENLAARRRARQTEVPRR